MVRIAVVGCAHGALDVIYEQAAAYNADKPPSDRIALILCCGDFECLRNTHDLACKKCPPQYKRMNSFHEYYQGDKKAPILTIFIGGNHEASNYLQELFYGGFVAPNIFYLGAAGVIRVAGLRIAGISGIYDAGHYPLGHFESAPYTNKTIASVYHMRALQVFQLSHLQSKIDIMMSHDWPKAIEQHGDQDALFAQRPDFQTSIANGTFGNPATQQLLQELKPRVWVAGHMHVNFQATVKHTTAEASNTMFYGVSKCTKATACMEILDIAPVESHEASQVRVEMDEEWLVILRATHEFTTISKNFVRLPKLSKSMQKKEQERAWMQERLMPHYANTEKARMEWVGDFWMTAPPYGQETVDAPAYAVGNPQTDAFLTFLELPHVVTKPFCKTSNLD